MSEWFKSILESTRKLLHSGSDIIMPPYLQGVTPRSIYVMVESKTSDPLTVDYGETVAFGNHASTHSVETTTEDTYVHRILLTGLKPNMCYHYQVRGYHGAYTFHTAVNPGTPFRFAWMADFRSGPKVHDQIATLIREAQPRVSFYGGDISRRSRYDVYKEDFFRPPQQALIARVPFFNATGNHEGWSVNTRAFTQGPPGMPDDGYYSVDYGDLHVLVLNNEIDYQPGSPQYEFAQKDLARTTRRWKMVINHKPPYGAGGHGENEGMKVMATHIFEPNKVDLVLSGHSHFYQHNLVNGIHYLIIGSAGSPLYTPEKAPYTLKSVKDYNYAITDVSPTSLQMTVYNHEKKVLDQLRLTKNANQSLAR